MEWPEVTVLICTYNRHKEIVKTISTLAEKLTYPNLKWLVCDDASPDGYIAGLKKVALFKELKVEFVSTEKTGGWGANVNNGMSHVKSEYIFFTEDDKLLYKPLDLTVGVALMQVKEDVGMVRYKGTAGTSLIMHQMEANISAWLPKHMDGPAAVQGDLTYLQLDSNSATLYLYSHGPHLKHKRFHQFYGIYPQGFKLGETEEGFAHMVRTGMRMYGAPALTILPDWVLPYFEDFGESYQGTEFDR